MTGLGIVSALGVGCAAHWGALAEGRNGIAPIERFSCVNFSSSLGATVRGLEATATTFGLVAAREAIRDAGLDAALLASPRTGFLLGATPTLLNGHAHTIAQGIADGLGIGGPVLCVSTACTSATIAFGVALDLLRDHQLDTVIAGGADALAPETYAGFDRLGVVSMSPCAPFSSPTGMTPGEGAGFFVLERAHTRPRRAAARTLELAGFGSSADAYHETAPIPSGEGVARAIRLALRDAQLDASAVGYVNAHATGTEQNDVAEVRGIRAALGAHAERVPVSGSKSLFGHALAAAGALEAVTTAMALREGVIPPTHNFAGARAGAPLDPVAERTPRRHAYRHAITTNSAFGGSNAALVLSVVDEGAPAERADGLRRKVSVVGVGCVTPFGIGPDALALVGSGSMVGPAVSYVVSDTIRTADPRAFDPAAAHLTVAARLALDNAGLRMRGALRDAAGLVVATPRVSAASDEEFRASIDGGTHHVSVRAFARNVLNASAGSAALALHLGGANITLSSGAAGGLLALVVAALELRHRDANDVVLAAGVDERRPHADLDGSVCLALQAQATGVQIRSWALGPRGSIEAVIADVITRGLGAEPPDLIVRDEGHESASGSMLAAARAVEAIRRASARTAVVATAPDADVACAVLFSMMTEEP